MPRKDYPALLLENQLCFPLYAASRDVIKLYRPYLDSLELTYTQYITMLVIWEEETVSVRDLGRRLHLDSGTLTPVLKHLEKKGLIRRQRSTLDERVLLVDVTDAGWELRERAKDIPVQMGKCVQLSSEEAKTLYRLLYKLMEALPAE